MHGMSSPNKMSVCGAGFGPEGGKQAGVHPADARALGEPVLGLERGMPCGDKSKQEVMEAGEPVLWDCEGQPGFPAYNKGHALYYASHLADESVVVAVTQQLSDQDVPAPRGFTSAVERQAVGQLDISSTMKMQSVFWEKVGSRPSYPGTGVGTDVSAASTDGLPQATPEKKAQGMKFLEDISKGTLEKTFPSWGQRVLTAPPEPATFPPVSGVPQLGKSKRYSLVRLNTKHSKHKDAGKNSVARRTREFELLVGEDNNPDGDSVPKGQHGECHTDDLDTRAAEVPRNSQPLTPIQKDIMPREQAPSVTRNHLTSPHDQKGSSNPLEHKDVVRMFKDAPLIFPLPAAWYAAMRFLVNKFHTL